jgi:hypothetical protein
MAGENAALDMPAWWLPVDVEPAVAFTQKVLI